MSVEPFCEGVAPLENTTGAEYLFMYLSWSLGNSSLKNFLLQTQFLIQALSFFL